MIQFSKDKVLLLHKLLAEATGGSIGLRDEGLLESALDGIYATFGGGRNSIPPKRKKALVWAIP